MDEISSGMHPSLFMDHVLKLAFLGIFLKKSNMFDITPLFIFISESRLDKNRMFTDVEYRLRRSSCLMEFRLNI